MNEVDVVKGPRYPNEQLIKLKQIKMIVQNKGGY